VGVRQSGAFDAFRRELATCEMQLVFVERIRVTEDAFPGLIVALPRTEDADNEYIALIERYYGRRSYEIVMHPDDWCEIAAPFWWDAKSNADDPDDWPEEPPVDGCTLYGIPVVSS
jgi:hypothetical protein